MATRIVLGAALVVLGLVAALGVAWAPATEAGAPRRSAPASVEPRSPAPPASTLARLGLDEAQREQIESLGMRERRRIEGLERAVAATERDLRCAELAQPFDAEYVNRLVARRAELAAHLRGTESRVVSEIAALLTPEQQRIFLELRIAGATAAPRARAARGAGPRLAGGRWNLMRR
jgi:Spy/CpxP family protein refolding chaperone